eukprot:m.189404 g.189404  ORF g.189404 m.189404 type:complete len:150 (+) comp32372_c6_seq1:185-634(+)
MVAVHVHKKHRCERSAMAGSNRKDKHNDRLHVHQSDHVDKFEFDYTFPSSRQLVITTFATTSAPLDRTKCNKNDFDETIQRHVAQGGVVSFQPPLTQEMLTQMQSLTTHDNDAAKLLCCIVRIGETIMVSTITWYAVRALWVCRHDVTP